jgi:hypothetical protein
VVLKTQAQYYYKPEKVSKTESKGVQAKHVRHGVESGAVMPWRISGFDSAPAGRAR